MISTRQHTLLKNTASILLLLASLAFASSSDSGPSVQWTKPVRGDVYGPGDMITGQWTIGDGSQAVNSPSFKLCSTGDGDSGGGGGNGSTDDGGGDDSKNASKDDGGDDSGDGNNVNGSQDSGNSSNKQRRSGGDDGASCGATVWPTVQESSGSYSVSLAVPSVASVSAYYLQMTDDFGNKINSPSFSLSPTPSSSSSSLPSSTASESFSTPSSTSKPSNTQALDSPTFTAPGSSDYPDLAAAHAPPPVAAFAIPLSIVGAIIVAALVLGIVHWRKLKQERAKDAENLKSMKDEEYLSRRSSLLSDASRGVGEKMSAWDARTTYAAPFPTTRSQWDAPSYIHAWGTRREPERKYVTRQAFPDDHYTAPNYGHNRFFRASTPSSGSVPAPNYSPSLRANIRPSWNVPTPDYNLSGMPPSGTVPTPPFAPYSSALHHMPRPPDLYIQDPHRYNAAVNHSVISNYLQSSPAPIPSSLLPSSPDVRAGSPSLNGRSFVPEPERLFVRRSAPPGMDAGLRPEGDVYDRVTRMLYPR
ncbi:hypothetical protein NEOLEDRAFT_1150229 [Neolentinus lepideus HHB14362 ss-1]|uniref:Uncharacterized protein n=1 Tax=Neolentinus lepideus HHB14362 ss-1 TaxID=1314782 RepID=A0A165Q8Z2_9AGAM|nr:hypothetical protein NEOLEDRAFT_1150229 [Neolentinus lepideus HHB14362 ss-1]